MENKDDLRLLQANIALFHGDRAEALRLTQAYRDSKRVHPADDPDTAMMLWLEAQAQGDSDSRVTHLRALISEATPDDPHVQMGHDSLRLEDHFRAQLAPPQKRNRMLPLLVLLMVIGAGAVFMLTRPDDAQTPQAVALVETSTPTPDPTATPYPDLSVTRVPADYQVRYAGGILQVAGIENESQRVLADDTIQTPVPGARFYAVRVIFECREGICNTPPQANLALQLVDGDRISAQRGASIAGEESLSPVALGHTTTGWVVFQIPLIGEVESLVVVPLAEDTDEVVIDLG